MFLALLTQNPVRIVIVRSFLRQYTNNDKTKAVKLEF